MSDVLADLEAMFAGMSPDEKANADKLIEAELSKPFLPNPGPQTEALESKADILLFGGSAGGGKAQSVESKVLSPKGWRRLGDIKKGDVVTDPTTGGHTTVLGVYPQGEQDLYEVAFDDGAKTTAVDWHLWSFKRNGHLGIRPGTKFSIQRDQAKALLGCDPVRTRWNTLKVGSTNDLAAAIESGDAPRIPLTEPVLFTVNGRTGCGIVPPYLLGLWLGDGCSRHLSFTSADEEIQDYVEGLGFRPDKHRLAPNGRALHYHPRGEFRQRLEAWLRNHGMRHKYSYEKHIPDYVFTAAISYRVEFLQGLMDSDGTVDERGHCSFTSTSLDLAEGVQSLVRGLGGKAKLLAKQKSFTHQGEKKDGRSSFDVSIWLPKTSALFKLSRKKARCTDTWNGGFEIMREVVSVKHIGRGEAVCIRVSSPRGLYVTDDYIVTHNTALEVGAYFLNHHTGVIFRREGTQLDGLIEFCKQIGEPWHGKFVGGNENVFKRNDGGRLKFAGLKEPDDWRKHAGNAKDLLCFDEAGEFLRDQVMNSIGWLRSTKEGQRCRVILASNPPRGGDGEWLIEEFAPWLDPLYPNPAKNGELRWAIVVAGVTEWVDGPGKFVRSGEEYEAMSRTFIPSRLNDNPYLSATGYRAKLQALPEPLRSQLLYGDFIAGREDHEWQVIPTEWVRLANERWRNAPQKRRRMIALAADVAGTGGDDNCLARLHEDAWFDEPVNFKGAEIIGPGEDALIPSRIADKMLSYRKDGADMSVDGTGGWGSGVRSRLSEDHKIDCASVVFSSGSVAKNKDKTLGFHNLRAEMYWRFREALDPDTGDDMALPPDKRLIAELTIPRYKIKGTNILIEAKDEIKKRAGSSPDRADAYVIAWHRRIAAHREAQRKERAAKSPIKLKMQQRPSPTGWMG